MVSTSEAEAANHPTQATKSPEVQSGLATFSPAHLIISFSFLILFRSFWFFLCLQGSTHQGIKLLHGAAHAFAVDASD